MLVKIVAHQATLPDGQVVKRRQVVDIPDDVAGQMIRLRWAVPAGDPDAWAAALRPPLPPSDPWSGFTLPELRAAAKAKGLSTRGSRAEVIARLDAVG